MPWLKEQIVCFLWAISFFTRIPIPKNTPFSKEYLNQSSRYFSLVGWIIGIAGALAYWITQHWFSNQVSIIVSMLVTIKLTGAFHEDGLADSADGLGGGMTIEKKLLIMKDSRIGTYGSVTLWGALTLKFALLQTIAAPLDWFQVASSLVIMHPLSRAVAGSLIYDTPYVRDDDSKAKPLAEQQRLSDCVILIIVGALPTFIFLSSANALILIGCMIALRFYAKYYLLRQLGGCTGDCLGAVQQISEIAGYMFLSQIIQH